ncbi:hypothetical protein [Terrabacter sp. MAHUQ-38]|jgi:hypothetical protein|uniref:hypothetical protein n=1 Tax=unclassified Terrabacter TaxID=2630222 RepID=UPI00165EB833|nr:hypothetical protein [Terrabacter sp. MAHUQ-38]MBC9819914.1 hypothetical protein [Terrabacter sp. MAHUQ-38]
MTYFWTGVGVLLVVGIGLIVWGSQSGPGRSGLDVSARRAAEMKVGALFVGVSLGALVIAYLAAYWP